MKQQAMRLGKDVLWTDGQSYWTVWHEQCEMYREVGGKMVPVRGMDGRPVLETLTHLRQFGTVDDRSGAYGRFAEWHEGRSDV